MRKTPLFGAFIASAAIMTSILFSGEIAFTAMANDDASYSWVHYAAREATSTQKGIREYWVACGQNHYQFTKPNSDHISEGQGCDTSEFLDDDPRYIEWIGEGVAFYDASSFSSDFSEVAKLDSGYKALDAGSISIGETGRAVFAKEGHISYSAPTMAVSGIIDSNDDLSKFCLSINGKETSGYYVVTSNLSSLTANTTVSSKETAFAGVFDGRGHIIDGLSSPNKHLFGYLSGATIKNVSFSNVASFGVLAESIENTLIDDCDFSLSSNASATGTGFLADNLLDGIKLSDVTLDFDTFSTHSASEKSMTYAIAKNNSSSASKVSYSNVTFRGLNSIMMYGNDASGGLLRPSEITYQSTLPFIKDSSSSYSAAYLSGNTESQAAASFFKDVIYKASGIVLPVTSISSCSVSLHKEPKVCFLDASLASSFGVSVPSSRGSFSILSAGQAILIFASDAMSYQAATLELSEKLVGYRYIAQGIETYTYQSGSSIDLPYYSFSFSPSFGYRKCDWSDSNDGDMYSFGYNQGYGDYMHFMTAMGNTTFSSGENYHTSLRVLGPVEFYSSHPNWFAVDSSGNTYGDDYSKWQLCYTAHGDSSEYESMLSQAVTYIKWIYDSKRDSVNQTSFLFGIADNDNVCHCSSCEQATSNYGSITGTVVKFVNDLSTRLVPSAPDITIGMFAYAGYEAAPLKNGSPTITLKAGTYTLIAPIKANYTYALTDSRNASHKQMFEDWAKVGKISAWLYDTNFLYYLFPFNSFKANHDNLIYLKEKGVEMVYLQGQHNATQPRTGFNSFKKFLAGKTMMDVTESYEDLKEEFFASYYGEGGELMEGFFDEMVAQLETIESTSSYQSKLYSSGQVNIYEDIQNSDFWSWNQLKKWRETCDSAYALATSEVTKKHILIESIFPRFATAVLYDYTKWDGTLSKTKKANLKAFRESLKSDCVSLGITIFRESGVTMDYYYYGDGAWGLDQ